MESCDSVIDVYRLLLGNALDAVDDGLDGAIFVFKSFTNDHHAVITCVVRILFRSRSLPFLRQGTPRSSVARSSSSECTERVIG